MVAVGTGPSTERLLTDSVHRKGGVGWMWHRTDAASTDTGRWYIKSFLRNSILITGESCTESINRIDQIWGFQGFHWDCNSVVCCYHICESESNLFAGTHKGSVDESYGTARRFRSELLEGAGVSDSGPGVLVVDDNEVIADTYAQFLTDDYDVEAVYSGDGALESLGHSVEVVLLDRRMPDRSGDEVLAQIQERALDCRVVMVTAVDPSSDIVDLPFDEYVVKPVGRSELLDVVDEIHRRASYDDPLRTVLALASKKATLEANTDESALADSEAYARIEARLAAQRDALGVDTERLERVIDGDVPDIVDTDDPDPPRSNR